MATLAELAAPSRATSEADVNQFNIRMRSQPWFQAFMQLRGLNPSGNGNRKLTRDEQGQLETLLRQNGMALPGGMHIDAGSSVNQKNRLARNTAIAAGIAAGGYFAAPALIGAMGGGAAAGGGLTGTTIGTGLGVAPASITGATLGGGGIAGLSGGMAAASAIPTLAGSTALGSGMAAAGPSAVSGFAPALSSSVVPAAGSGSLLGKAAMGMGPQALKLGAGLYAQHSENAASDRAAALQANASREALEYQRQQDALARQDALDAQALNQKMYDADILRTQRIREEDLARKEPYRQFGIKSLGQLGRPIAGVGVMPGSLGGRLGR